MLTQQHGRMHFAMEMFMSMLPSELEKLIQEINTLLPFRYAKG